MDPLQERYQAALLLAAEAGAIAMRLRPPAGAPRAKLKGAQDWLTEADGAVEAFLSQRLAALFPDDGFLGEENGRARSGRFCWVADPIDGTSNYARGSARFCISLGLLEEATPRIGVIVAPALGETFAARAGHGATLNGAPIRVAETTDFTRATVECGWTAHLPYDEYGKLIVRLMDAGAAVRDCGSGTLGLADVACGRLDGYVERRIHLWDVAAALCVLEEAGATVSPFLSGPGAGRDDPILAAAPGIARAFAALLPFAIPGWIHTGAQS